MLAKVPIRRCSRHRGLRGGGRGRSLLRPARLYDRRPARRGGEGVARPGRRGREEHRLSVPPEEDHREFGPRRRPERGLGVRPAHRRGDSPGLGDHLGGSAGRPSAAGRALPGRAGEADQGRAPHRRGHAGQEGAQRPDPSPKKRPRGRGGVERGFHPGGGHASAGGRAPERGAGAGPGGGGHEGGIRPAPAP